MSHGVVLHNRVFRVIDDDKLTNMTAGRQAGQGCLSLHRYRFAAKSLEPFATYESRTGLTLRPFACKNAGTSPLALFPGENLRTQPYVAKVRQPFLLCPFPIAA